MIHKAGIGYPPVPAFHSTPTLHFQAMRPLPATLTATGLLIFCVILILCFSGSETPDAKSGGNTPLDSSSLDRKSPPQARVDAASPPASDNSQEPIAGDALPSPELPNENPASTPPAGIRLADDVQLPAVILAINAVKHDPNSKLPAPVAAAMYAIVDTFYPDLAEASRQAGAEASPDEENTLVIKPGPAVDRARGRADETYRALFGDDAFNRMTLNAALEVRLPVNPDWDTQ